MGIITDSTSCEAAQFTAPNPFSTMTVDVYAGVAVTQTQTVELSTVWNEACSYTLATSPAETWLTVSTPTATSIQFDVQSTDLSLAGTTSAITVNLTPDYIDSDGYPASVIYTFNVNFVCVVSTLSFPQQTSDQAYVISSGPHTSDSFLIQQTPSCGLSESITWSSSPDASSFAALNTSTSSF